MVKSSKRSNILGTGKLPHSQLKKLLAAVQRKNSRLILGPEVGLDAALVKTPENLLVVTSDPITLASDLSAYYCIHVNANDIAVMGAEPEFMTIVALAPPIPQKEITKIARQLTKYTNELDITIIGGHTEITNTVNVPILIATMFGKLKSKKIISAASARPGDRLIMTKTAAIESTAIIAREKSDILRKNGFSHTKIKKCGNLLFAPGISIIPEAKIAAEAGCSGMHDATEGGIISAVWELTQASKVKIELDIDAISILPETKEACKLFHINPLRSISSGSLLITIAHKKADNMLDRLKKANIHAKVIGKVTKGKSSLINSKSNKTLKPCQDQITKIYA